jgi:signal peptidase I
MKELKNTILIVVFAVLLALVFRGFVVEAYRIPSSSMRPTLEAGDTVFVWKWGYGSKPAKKEPQVGEVIVFNSIKEPSKDFIKRVLAKTGDEISFKAGDVWINGSVIGPAPQKETLCRYENRNEVTYQVCFDAPALKDMGPIKLEKNQYFVMGDFRKDATLGWEIITAEAVRGVAWRIWISVEPNDSKTSRTSWFSRFRFERMLKRIL